MPTSSVMVSTEHASRYLQQLCKHWAHKFETEFTPLTGRIALPLGVTQLDADENGLSVKLTAANADDMPQFRDVVQRHIERFAFREELKFDWVDAA